MVNGMKLSDEELCNVVGSEAKTVTQEKTADKIKEWEAVYEWEINHASEAPPATVPLLLRGVNKIKESFALKRCKPFSIIR